MGRIKAMKRKKGDHLAENMLRAIQLYRTGMSLRKAARACEVHYPTLYRYAKKHKDVIDSELSSQRLTPNYDVNRIFTAQQEEELKSYIKECASKFYGLSSRDVRSVAYQMAKINKIKYPASWESDTMAGVEWFRSFKGRHSDLTLKKPEACSLARATAFNRETVSNFFFNLKNTLDRHPSFGNGCRVYNLDETATGTVQKTKKVMALKGRHNLGQITSGEKGTLVTTCAIVCASGQAIPPVLVFPRKNYKDHMLIGAPPGSLGLAAPSGWMNAELMQHFIKHTCASPENPALLIMDNHESHLSIEALDLAKKSGVCVLTLHPHTTAKMQPLDVGLNGPFKTYYNSAIDSWLRRNPGKQVKIYNVAECVGQAYQKAMTPVNITAAFKKCGIFPFNADIFEEIDFMPSEVTNREQNVTSSGLPTPTSSVIVDRGQSGPSSKSPTTASSAITDREQAGPSTELHTSVSSDHQRRESICPDSPSSDATYVESPPHTQGESPPHPQAESPPSPQAGLAPPAQAESPSILETDGLMIDDVLTELIVENSILLSLDLNLLTSSEKTPPSDSGAAASSSSGIRGKFKSPKDFMPSLKAGPRIGGRKPRKLGRSMIATDTPEKNIIAEEKQKAKARKSVATKTKRPVLSEKKENKIRKKAKINITYSDEETSEDEENVLCQSKTESIDLDEEDKNSKENLPLVTPNFKRINGKPKEGDYVMVGFDTKKNEICYIALITEKISANKYGASFMRVKDKTEMKFYMPLEPDLSEIKLTDIKMILPEPKITGTKNRNSFYIFPLRVSPKLNLR